MNTESDFNREVAAQAVDNGFTLLERNWPGFYLGIDAWDLNLAESETCVLGQLSDEVPLPLWCDYAASPEAALMMLREEYPNIPDDELMERLTALHCRADWDIARNFLGLDDHQAGYYGFTNVIPSHEDHPVDDGSFPGCRHIEVSYSVLTAEWVRRIIAAQAAAVAGKVVPDAREPVDDNEPLMSV